jgi:hypothetical protein
VGYVSISFTGHNLSDLLFKTAIAAGHWWLMPAILATQEAEIRRIAVQSQLDK